MTEEFKQSWKLTESPPQSYQIAENPPNPFSYAVKFHEHDFLFLSDREFNFSLAKNWKGLKINSTISPFPDIYTLRMDSQNYIELIKISKREQLSLLRWKWNFIA